MLGLKKSGGGKPVADAAHLGGNDAGAPSSAELALVAKAFDPAFYLRSYADVRVAGVDPLAHYLRSGWREGRNPSATFDSLFYATAVSAADAPDACPLVHHVTTEGAQGYPTTRAEARTNHVPAAVAVKAALRHEAALRKLFDEAFYRARYPDVDLAGTDPLLHYLETGWKEGRMPGPGFDTTWYRMTFQHGDGSDICPLVHFHLFGQPAGLPTDRAGARAARKADAALPDLPLATKLTLVAPHFDAGHYLRRYPDIAQTGVDPLWHYMVTGWAEEREPSPLFSPKHYVTKHIGAADAKVNPLWHFAVVGRAAGLDASPATSYAVMQQAADAIWSDTLRDVLGRLGFDAGLVRDERIRRFVLPMFSAASYRALRGLDDGISDVDCFMRYLALDLPGGLPPGPMFSADHYLSECDRLGLPRPKPFEKPFHHWLEHGAQAQVSPNPAFDVDYYRKINPDLAGYPGPLFEHFLQHGLTEGRWFNPLTYVAPCRLAPLSGDRRNGARQFCEFAGETPGAAEALSGMAAFRSSSQMKALVEAATALEPDIAGLTNLNITMIPHWHDEGWGEYRQFLKMLPEGPFDHLVILPFCKLGGADFIAGHMVSALAEHGRVLILRTDAPDWARPDWFPPEVPTVDLSAHFGGLQGPIRERILYELIQRLRPKGVYNVNSRLCFDTFEKYGERLAMTTRLHAYYFCTDYTEDGVEVGYPIWYFSNILPWLHAALIDNAALTNRLIERYGLSGPYRDKLRVIYTPTQTPQPEVPLVEQQIARAAKRGRKRLLWAGRFDRQKRFDLLVAIARAMPEVDFDAWGKAVLDAPPDLDNLPPNLRLHEPFKVYADLPLADADGWLFTSAWEGLPTTLSELGVQAVPVVATVVGGVGELITPETGWPVDAEAPVETYVATITDMLSDPDERRRRALAYQARATTQHTRDNYRRVLAGQGV